MKWNMESRILLGLANALGYATASELAMIIKRIKKHNEGGVLKV